VGTQYGVSKYLRKYCAYGPGMNLAAMATRGRFCLLVTGCWCCAGVLANVDLDKRGEAVGLIFFVHY